MARDLKYGRVTTEFGDIGEDEPVIVFRSQDGLLPSVLDAYRELCEQYGSPDKHLKIIDQARQAVLDWQSDESNRIKFPPDSRGPAGQRLDID